MGLLSQNVFLFELNAVIKWVEQKSRSKYTTAEMSVYYPHKGVYDVGSVFFSVSEVWSTIHRTSDAVLLSLTNMSLLRSFFINWLVIFSSHKYKCYFCDRYFIYCMQIVYVYGLLGAPIRGSTPGLLWDTSILQTLTTPLNERLCVGLQALQSPTFYRWATTDTLALLLLWSYNSRKHTFLFSFADLPGCICAMFK